MLTWFEQHAPIRVKFRALLCVYSLLGGVSAAAATYAALHAQGINQALVIGVAGGALLAIVGVTLLAARLICTPYVTTVVRMEGLAAGDLASEVRHTGHRDCVGRMTKAMASFRENSLAAAECNTQRVMALAMGEGLSRLAAGDLTYRIDAELSGAFVKLKDDFNAAVGALGEAMGAVAQSSDGIHRGSGEIRSASDDLSQRTEQQAASLEETAAALDQLTGTVRRTAQDAGRASDVVSAARQNAERGGDVVRRAVGAMSDIERSATEISEIISVIDGIAFQTNLLALNAGVEAARAGDAGKGFAVVASEVRALAQRSADAAKDVKTRILRSSEQVGVGVSLVNETGEALDAITARIAEVNQLVSAIAAAAGEQSASLGEVNTAVASMDGVTQQNAAMVEQTNAAARRLAGEADHLMTQIGRFTTGTPVAAPSNVHELPRPRIAAPARSRPKLLRAGGGGAAAAQVDDWAEF